MAEIAGAGVGGGDGGVTGLTTTAEGAPEGVPSTSAAGAGSPLSAHPMPATENSAAPRAGSQSGVRGSGRGGGRA